METNKLHPIFISMIFPMLVMMNKKERKNERNKEQGEQMKLYNLTA